VLSVPVNMVTCQRQNILTDKHKNILASWQFLDSRIDETAKNKYAMQRRNVIFHCTEDKMRFDSFNYDGSKSTVKSKLACFTSHHDSTMKQLLLCRKSVIILFNIVIIYLLKCLIVLRVCKVRLDT